MPEAPALQDRWEAGGHPTEAGSVRPSAAEAPSLILAAFLPYRLSVLANRVSQALARLYRDRFGLGIPEWRVMAVVGQRGELSSFEIVRLTAMDKAKVSRALSRLVARGYVRRDSHPDDQRTNRVQFTAAGRTVYDEIAALALRWERELLSDLDGTETQAIAVALSALDARIDALDSGALT